MRLHGNSQNNKTKTPPNKQLASPTCQRSCQQPKSKGKNKILRAKARIAFITAYTWFAVILSRDVNKCPFSDRIQFEFYGAPKWSTSPLSTLTHTHSNLSRSAFGITFPFPFSFRVPTITIRSNAGNIRQS